AGGCAEVSSEDREAAGVAMDSGDPRHAARHAGLGGRVRPRPGGRGGDAMSIVSRQLFLWCIAAAATIASLTTFAPAHESPVDHVTRVIDLRIADGRLYLIYRIELGERASLLEMHKIDANGDGSIS